MLLDGQWAMLAPALASRLRLVVGGVNVVREH